MTSLKMTEPMLARMRALWVGSMTLGQIAKELGVADATLQRSARLLGLSRRRPNKSLSEDQKAEIVRMWRDGARVMEIARTFGCHHPRVLEVLSKYRNAPGRSARLAARPDPSTSPHRALTGRITPEIAVRGAQTTHLLRSAIKRRTIPIGPPPRQCQYPTGERPYTFCLDPVVPGRPYCCEHTARCYVKVKPMAVVPAKPKEPFVEFKW